MALCPSYRAPSVWVRDPCWGGARGQLDSDGFPRGVWGSMGSLGRGQLRLHDVPRCQGHLVML